MVNRFFSFIKSHYLALIIISSGLLLRVYRLDAVAGFDFDQETAAMWVKSFLIDHKLSLIGQEISVGGIFTGPGYYYLLGIFYWLFHMDPLAGNILQTLFAIGTMIVLYRISGKIGLFVYSFSNAMIIIDQTYNPSTPMIFLSSLSLLFIKNLPAQIALSGIGWNFHPISFLYFPIGLAISILNKTKINYKMIAVSLLFAIIGILPILIFETRHDFMQFHNLVRSFLGLTLNSDNYPYLFKFVLLSKNSIEALLYILGLNVNSISITVSLLVLFYFRKIIANLWVFILVPIVIFSFYPLHVPNYYLLTIYPGLIVLVAKILKEITKEKIGKILLATFLFIFLAINVIQSLSNKNPFGMAFKKSAVNYILKKERNASIKIETDLGLNNGFNYLFWLYGKEVGKDNVSPNYTIYLPDTKSNKTGVVFGSIKVVEN